MPFVTPDLAPALTEIVLATGLCVVLIVDLFLPREWKEMTYALAMLALVAGVAALAAFVPTGTVETFSGSFITDPLGRILKLFAFAVMGMVLLYSRAYLRMTEFYRGEYYTLCLFALLGTCIMISAYSMLTMYLGLEMLSLSLYALIAIDRNSGLAAESAMKYFVLGAIASGTLLYGISILYGVTGSLAIPDIAYALLAAETTPLVVFVGLAFVIVGVAFKLGAVPFHMWLPDVYQGSPACVTLLVGTVPKLAAFALAIRVLVEALGPVAAQWETMITVLAILSLAVGNIVAIAQTNIKRMLAYSTIGHVGFILLGVVTGTAAGLQAALFYTIVYVLMAAAAFAMIILLSRRGHEAGEIEDFRGLNARSRWFAFIMLIVMVSMIGVPPFAGFYAKWAVLAALVDAGQTWLAVAGVLFSVIGAYYYLRVIRMMYFEDATDTTPIDSPLDMRILLSANGLSLLALGVFPGGLLGLCAIAFS